MTHKFTSGPWKYTPRKSGEDHTKDDVMTVSHPARRIANIFGENTQEPYKYNAMLIACAPELLEILEMLVPFLESCAVVAKYAGETKAQKEIETKLKLARNIIAKATGNTHA